MPKKAFPILLILAGAALALGALLSWLDNLTAAQPVGLGKWVFDVLQFLLGAAGTGLGAWLNFGRKDKTPPANRITNIGSSHQTAIGDQARNVQTGAGSVAVGGDVMYSSITIQQTVEKQLAVALFTIPPPVADFTGREKELAELKAAFARGALITGVSGAGGIGKTELARRLAQELAGDFPAARLSIDLLGASERPLPYDEAMRRLLEPFYPNQKLPDEPEQLAGLYRQTFAARKSLLLLDNAADAAQVRPLIPPPPSAAIVTSRQHFTLSEFGLTPLRLDVLPPVEAHQFLRATSPKLRDAPDAEVEKLADLCGRLPLALRVAASLLNDRADWTPATLRKRLADERTRLTRLKREGDLDVEAAISLSYNLLDDDLKTRFRQLGVFTAPFLRLSAQAVWGIADEAEADDLLGKLTTRNLLNVSPSPFAAEAEGEAVYALHDLTRLFAYARLLENHEQAEEAILRHAHHALEWASAADDLFEKGNENILRGLARFRFIWPHLLAAYERLLPDQEPRPRPAKADRWLSAFPGRCVYVLDLHLPPRQKIPLLQAALEAARRLGDRSDEGIHLGNLGLAYAALGDARKAIEFYEKRLAIAREIGDRRGEGNSLGNLGSAYFALGDARKAIEFYEQALAIDREIGDRRGEGADLGNLGNAYFALGNARKAIEFHQQALAVMQEISDKRAEGSILGNLGLAYYDLGDARKAIEFHEQALAIDREIGDRRGEGNALGNLGLAYAALGDARKAIEFYEKHLAIAREIGDRRGEGNALGNLGLAYYDLGDARKAIEFHEQALAIDREIGDRRGEGNALGNLGLAYADLGDARKAIEFYEKRLAIAREIGDRRGEGNSLGNLGSAYFALGDARKAIEFYEQALAIDREIGDRRGEGAALGNLGLAYAALGDARKAIEFYEKCLELHREIGDRRGEGAALGNLGNAYADLGDARKAIEFYEKCLAIAREIGDRRGEGNALGNLGNAYAALGDARKAIEFYEKRLAIAQEIGDRRGEGADLGNLGLAYAALGDARKAIEFHEQALAVMQEIGDKRAEGSILGNLGNAYFALGDARKAIEFHEKHLAIAREIGDRRGEGNALANMGMAYKKLGDKEKAKALWQAALAIFRAIESPRAEKVEKWLAELE